MSIVKRFPKSWRTSVIVLRSGGRDVKGNPLPDVEIPKDNCLIAPRMTAEPVDRSDVVVAKPALYRDNEPGFSFLSTDRIRVPEGARMSGDWEVDGLPGEWPMGVEVPLVRS